MTLRNLPQAAQLPAGLQKLATEYADLRDRNAAASEELFVVTRAEGEARRADAAAIGELARSDADVTGFANPAQAAWKAKVAAQQTLVDGLRAAMTSTEAEFAAAFEAHSGQGVKLSIDTAAKARARYEKAIDDLEAAARSFNGSLAMLSGWRNYLASAQRPIAFSANPGFIHAGGSRWLEPPDVATMAATLRQHATWDQVIVNQIVDTEAAGQAQAAALAATSRNP